MCGHPVHILARAPTSSVRKVTWPGPPGKCRAYHLSFKPLNLKGKCPVEVLLVGETLQAVCNLPWLAIFLYQLLAPKNVIQILLGPFPTTWKGNTNRKGSLGKPKKEEKKKQKETGISKWQDIPHQHLKLVRQDWFLLDRVSNGLTNI